MNLLTFSLTHLKKHWVKQDIIIKQLPDKENGTGAVVSFPLVNAELAKLLSESNHLTADNYGRAVRFATPN